MKFEKEFLQSTPFQTRVRKRHVEMIDSFTQTEKIKITPEQALDTLTKAVKRNYGFMKEKSSTQHPEMMEIDPPQSHQHETQESQETQTNNPSGS